MSQGLTIDHPRDAFARALPFALYILFLAVAPLLAKALPETDLRWLYAVQTGAVLLALVIFSRHYVELRAAPCPSLFQWLAALGAGFAVFVVWIHFDLPWMKVGAGGTAGFDPRDDTGELIWPLALVRLAGAALVVPVMEELFWRSFVMRWIDRPKFLALAPAAVSLRAWLISSVVFGVEHDLWLAGLIAGLVYGWLYIRTGNLWSPILAHGATNLMLGLWVLDTGNWHFW